MAYDIKLYIHGVPNGFDTWGVESSDTYYIKSFYSGRASNFNPPTQMLVEVKNLGSGTYCYYTYIQAGKVNGTKGSI